MVNGNLSESYYYRLFILYLKYCTLEYVHKRPNYPIFLRRALLFPLAFFSDYYQVIFEINGSSETL